jgi:hypothetical protein
MGQRGMGGGSQQQSHGASNELMVFIQRNRKDNEQGIRQE